MAPINKRYDMKYIKVAILAAAMVGLLVSIYSLGHTTGETMGFASGFAMGKLVGGKPLSITYIKIGYVLGLQDSKEKNIVLPNWNDVDDNAEYFEKKLDVLIYGRRIR